MEAQTATVINEDALKLQKAYDFEVFVKRLKARGLEISEEALKMLIIEMFKFLRESAPLSSTPYDDMALIVYPQIESMLLKAIDKIDGQVG